MPILDNKHDNRSIRRGFNGTFVGKGLWIAYAPPMDIYIKGITLTALPGIIIQLIFIPMIVRAYEKIGILSGRK